MADESVEFLESQVAALEDRVAKLEEAIQPANLAAAIAKRQRDLSV